MIGGVVRKDIFFAAFGSANVGRKSPALKFLLALGIAGAKFISPISKVQSIEYTYCRDRG